MAHLRGQIVKNPATSFPGKGFFLELASPAFWNKHFPGGGGQPDWDKASDALMRECDRMGVFQPGRVRGRGAWLDEDGEFVIHLGDRLLAPGEKRYRAPDRYTAEQKIYPRAQSLAGPSTERVLTVEESRHILQLFVDLRWTHPAAGYLLAGWTALAPFCGALPRRPHILLTGASPSGKTTIVRRMIIPLLGEMLMAVDCGSNEAGIRQYMGADALPVIYDHADSHHVYPVLGLARRASFDGAWIGIRKRHSKAQRNYQSRSMFLFASSRNRRLREADKTHFSLLRLKRLPRLDDKHRAQWRAFQHGLEEHFTVENGRRFLARTTEWLRTGRFDALRDVSVLAAHRALPDAGLADQYGTLAAGAWMYMTDDIPTESEIVDWFHTIRLSALIRGG